MLLVRNEREADRYHGEPELPGTLLIRENHPRAGCVHAGALWEAEFSRCDNYPGGMNSAKEATRRESGWSVFVLILKCPLWVYALSIPRLNLLNEEEGRF